jgi:hypothetical protein
MATSKRFPCLCIYHLTIFSINIHSLLKHLLLFVFFSLSFIHMSYVPVPIALTHDKIRKLARGYGIRLAPEHIGVQGGAPIHMTRRQADKAARQSRMGKGMILRLSQAQIRHHMKGEGWFSDIVGAGKKALQKVAPGLIDKALPFVQKGAHALIDKYAPSSVRDIAKKGVSYGSDKLADYGKSQFSGGGIRGRGVMAGRGVGSKRTRTGQTKRSANHPVVTSFERDPLPGEHFAIPQ